MCACVLQGTFFLRIREPAALSTIRWHGTCEHHTGVCFATHTHTLQPAHLTTDTSHTPPIGTHPRPRQLPRGQSGPLQSRPAMPGSHTQPSTRHRAAPHWWAHLDSSTQTWMSLPALCASYITPNAVPESSIQVRKSERASTRGMLYVGARPRVCH